VDSTRNWYAMSRAEALPSWLNRIHPAYRTPYTAVLAQTALALIIGVGAGSLVAPDQSFYMLGTLGTIIYVFVYTMGNIGVVRFFLTVKRHELNVLIHLVFPVLSTIALLLVLYYSLIPLPSPPVSYAPAIGGVLLVAGLAVLWRLQSRRGTAWQSLSQSVVEPEHDAEMPLSSVLRPSESLS
jgi:amino acid transporter